MTEHQQNSISSAVFGLQSSLHNLKQQLFCLQNKPSEEIRNKPNELHALGKVNLDKAREEFAQHINIIRNVCSQFETEVLGDVMKMGAGADPAFRKHFTHLKEQAMLESTVRRFKETLKQTKEYFDNSIREKEESKLKIETQRLEKIAQSMGLVTFIDSTQKFESDVPITTITLGGTVIVVDIDIDNMGRILRAKVTYVSEGLQNDKDDRVDAMLAENLQKRQFELFKRNLGSLALLDQLNVKYNPTDFFLITKNLFNDFVTIYQQEISMESDASVILLEGHGIPTFHLGYPGISIAYWMNKEQIKSIDWEEVKTSLFDKSQSHPLLSLASRVLITFEDSIQLMYYLPTQSRTSYLLGFEETEESINNEQFTIVTETTAPIYMPQLHYLKPLPSHPEAKPVPIRFVMILDPPLPVSDELCQKLLNITGLLNMDATRNTASKSPSTLSLEEILISDLNEEEDKNNTTLLTDHSWKMSFVDKEKTYKMIYKWMSFLPSSGKLVSRIPFQHPVQIFNILQCLRQQQVFNTLFKSIFNKNTCCVKEENNIQSISLQDILLENNDTQTIKIEVNTADAPNSLHISFTSPPLHNQQSSFIIVPITIDIPSNQPTKPTIRLYSPSNPTQHWNSRIFDIQQLTQQIQAHLDVPTLIQTLYKTMMADNTYLIIQQKRRLSEQDINTNKSMKMEID